MKKTTRRLLSLLLCLAMLMSMVPTAMAEETEPTEEVQTEAPTEPAEVLTEETTEEPTTEPAEAPTEAPAEDPTESAEAETEPVAEPVEIEPESETTEQKMAVYSSGSCGPSLSWTMDSYGNLTISGSGKMNDFRYPDVTPWDDLSVNSVVIKEGVTSIGYRAFSDCRYMLTIALPRSLTTINDNFYDCTWLSEIHYAGTPSEFEQINGKLSLEDKGRKQVIDWHFRSPGRNEYDYFPKLCGNNVAWSLDLKTGTLTISGTGEMWDKNGYHMWDDPSQAMRWKSPWNSILDRISSVVITDGVTSVGANVFLCWDNLMSVALPDSMTKIGDYAFTQCTRMSMPSFPSTLTYIGEMAFNLCLSLTNKVNLPRATYIGESAFDGCRSLPELTISKPGVKIGKFAFSDCRSLKKVVLPEAASISSKAFSSCSALRELVISDGVTKLGDSAFSYCTALKTITLPRSLTDVGKSAFGACSALTDVYYQGSKKDRDGINIVQPNTELESAQWHYAIEEETTVPLYRLYSPNSGEHLYTSDVNEWDFLGTVGWIQEGIAWYAATEGDPVYRLYNAGDGSHLYTMNQQEIESCVSIGWTVDGVVTYSAGRDGVPVIRLYSPVAVNHYHLYTVDRDEIDKNCALGWIEEGVAWYAAGK